MAIVLMVTVWGANNRDGLGTPNGAQVSTQGTTKGGSGGTLTNAPTRGAATVGIGTKVRDGDFDFVVTGVEHPGKTLDGKVGEILTAQGEFVIVLIDVTNIGKKEQAPNCSCQIVFDDKGQMFEPSPAVLRTKQALKFVRLIPPGETVKGIIMLFDVPPGTTLVHIELHNSPVSPGVDVKLT